MLTDARFKFALESLKKCAQMEPKNNIFFSPQLLYQNLLMVYFGTRGDVEDSLKKILFIPDDICKIVIQHHYYLGGVNKFCYSMGTSGAFTCRIFSRFLVNENKILYTGTVSYFSFAHQVKEVNFDVCPNHARMFVNNCVKTITQGCLNEDVLPPESIHSQTDTILLNVIYCTGYIDYNYEFELEADDNSGSVHKKNTKYSMLMKKCVLRGKSEKLNACLLELPFPEKKISTFFIYPETISVIDLNSESNILLQLIERLTTEEGSGELYQLLNDGLTCNTNLVYPTFNIKQDLDTYRLLDMLGLSEFTPSGTGELTEFATYSLNLGDAVHRVNIKVSEKTITAAACDVFFSRNECQHTKISTNTETCFPCIYLMYDRLHRHILFCGILQN